MHVESNFIRLPEKEGNDFDHDFREFYLLKHSGGPFSNVRVVFIFPVILLLASGTFI